MARPLYQDPSRRSIEERSKAYDSRKLHEDDDLDAGRTAHHHTLGMGSGQAAPGDALAALLERVEALETMLNTPPMDFEGNFFNENSNSLVGLPGVSVAAGWSFGTNFAAKQGYVATVYFNLTPTVAVAGSATGDIANITILSGLPLDLQGHLNEPLYHSINGPEFHSTSGGTHITNNGSNLILPTLPGGMSWNPSNKSFGGTYLTRTWGWNL